MLNLELHKTISSMSTSAIKKELDKIISSSPRKFTDYPEVSYYESDNIVYLNEEKSNIDFQYDYFLQKIRIASHELAIRLVYLYREYCKRNNLQRTFKIRSRGSCNEEKRNAIIKYYNSKNEQMPYSVFKELPAAFADYFMVYVYIKGNYNED